jgi:Ca2+-binding EF-hand superfamily protein
VAEMIKEADLDGDNKVSYTEFKAILYDNSKHK